MKAIDKHISNSAYHFFFKLIITLMILAITSIILTMNSTVYAATVTLAWDANQSAPDGYRLYTRTNSTAYNFSQPAWSGKATTASLSLQDNIDYYFVVRAFIGSSESASSNEAYTKTLPTTTSTYTITATAASGGTISPSGSTTVNQGGSIQYTITPNSNYSIQDVVVDGISVGSRTSYTFTSVSTNHSIEAKFTANLSQTFTIRSGGDSTGTISPSGTIAVPAGSSQSFIMTPKDGYKISTVWVDGYSKGAVSSYTFTNVTANHVIAVSFTATEAITITSTAGANGTISPSGNLSLSYGSSQTFTAIPSNGYEVTDLFVDGVSKGAISAYTFTNITSSHTISAAFGAINQPPSANAGPDQMVDEGVQVTLSGVNSMDLDDGISTINWKQIEGPSVVLSNPNAMNATFTSPDVNPEGSSLTFQLTVTDKSGASSTDTCIVNVSWVNEPPVASVLDGLTAKEGEMVTLDATDSYDPDDGIKGFSWKQISGTAVTLSDATSDMPQFAAPKTGSEGESLSFQVTVTDMGGLQSQASCIVNIVLNNTPPVANAGPDQTVKTNEWTILKGEGSYDTDGGIQSYLWTQTLGTPVSISNVTAMNPGFTAPAIESEQEILEFTLTVTDYSGLKHTDSCQITVVRQSDMTGAEITITYPTSSSTYKSSTGTITLSGTTWDESGVNLVYWWTNKNKSGTATGTTNWTINNIPLVKGSNKITVAARDNAGNRSSKTITVQY